MEVQKHPHHVAHKKKWHEYILEFAMLFLAVFLGFLAENMREKQVEHEREREYMVTMVEDLQSDIPIIDSTMREWEWVNRSVDSVVDAIGPTMGTTDLTKVYRHINEALNPWSFKYNDRTITQLKNAGGFRLLRNDTVSHAIISYDQFNNDALLNIASEHLLLYNSAMALKNKALIQAVIYNIYTKFQYNMVPASKYHWIDSLIVANKVPLKEDVQNVALFEFKNALLAYRLDFTASVLWGYRMLRERNLQLMALIRKEYDL
jgi:hypothetical protein